MTPLISVVMPVYNCAPYLKAALDSVLEQSDVSLEVIAIDDASSDETPALLASLAEQDTRIRAVFHKENCGVGAVRNEAMALAKGEYVAFCDADDIVPQGAYAALLKIIGDKDVAIGTFCDKEDDGTTNHAPLDRRAAKSSFFALFSVCCLWTKLFKRSFLTEHLLQFDEDMTLGEDVVFLAHAATYMPSYALTGDVVYYHCNHNTAQRSLTHIFDANKFALHIACRRKLLAICQDIIPSCRDYVYLEFSTSLSRFLAPVEGKEGADQAFLLYRDFMTEYDFSHCPNRFLAMTGIPFEEFKQMGAAEYFARRANLTPRDQVHYSFLCGDLGFRWIWKYIKAWFRFKLFRR